MKGTWLLLLLITISQAQVRPGFNPEPPTGGAPSLNTNIRATTPSIESASFSNYYRNYGTMFSINNDNYRAMVFANNLKKIQEHNADRTTTYQMGVNQFTGLTQDEFERFALGLFVDDRTTEKVRIADDVE